MIKWEKILENIWDEIVEVFGITVLLAILLAFIGGIIWMFENGGIFGAVLGIFIILLILSSLNNN